MTDENERIENEEESEMTGVDYAAEIERIRNGMVTKEEYNRVLRDNKALADSLANGGGRKEEDEKTYSPEDVDRLRKKIFSEDNHYRNNMSYFADVIEFRKAVIENGGDDPFLPHNHNYVPTEQDAEKAEYIASQIEECLEYADGDPRLFNVDLQRRCGVNNNKRKR